MMRVEEVESTHSLVRDSHPAGREAAAAEGLAAAGEEVVEACRVVGDRVDPVEWEEVQDLARLVFLPLYLRTRCLDRDRLRGGLVGMNPHFEEDHQCLVREDFHLSPRVRGGVAKSPRHICDMSMSSLIIELRSLTSASGPDVSVP